jgi:type I restriction enzyme R subunit
LTNLKEIAKIVPDKILKRLTTFSGQNTRYELNIRGDYRDFDKEFAIDAKRFWHFLETTQAKELKKFEREPNYKQIIIERMHRVIKKYGLLCT